jgi:hypothetical protein
VGDKNICYKIYFIVVNLLVRHTSAKTVGGIDVELIAFSDGY